MLTNEPAKLLFQYIVDDFEKTWDALVETCKEDPSKGGGSNFMFGLMSMVLLEFVCRVCEKSGGIAAFETALRNIEPKYFTPLPGMVSKSAVQLPGVAPGTNGSTLLALIFELLRNGKAHQYSSMIAQLPGGGCIDFGIAGPRIDRAIKNPARVRPAGHLGYQVDGSDVYVLIRPDQLFLDIKHAAEQSGVITDTCQLDYLQRLGQTDPAKPYGFTVEALIQKLHENNHVRCMVRLSGGP